MRSRRQTNSPITVFDHVRVESKTVEVLEEVTEEEEETTYLKRVQEIQESQEFKKVTVVRNFLE